MASLLIVVEAIGALLWWAISTWWVSGLTAGIEFAIGARRIVPLWRLLDGLGEADWTDAIDMVGVQVAVADYCPNW